MLNIINNLSPFFEDCYREVGVREYSRLRTISPPTASKLLDSYFKEGLLKKRVYRTNILFSAKRDNRTLKNLSLIYWENKFSELLDYLDSVFYSPEIILFGSLSKLEVSENSDLDLAIFSKIDKKLDLVKFEKKLGRKIQLFMFKSLGDVKGNIRESILNGFVLRGELK